MDKTSSNNAINPWLFFVWRIRLYLDRIKNCILMIAEHLWSATHLCRFGFRIKSKQRQRNKKQGEMKLFGGRFKVVWFCDWGYFTQKKIANLEPCFYSSE